MISAILYSENNDFSVNLINSDDFKKNIDVKCIIASDVKIETLKNKFPKIDIISTGDFERCKINFINENIKNLPDDKNSNLFSSIESECIKLLDFANANHNRFSLIDSRRTFTTGYEFVLNFLDHYSPELLIFTNTPHSFQSYLMFKICEILKIKTLFKRELSWPDTYIFQNKIENSFVDTNFFNKNTKVRKILSGHIKNIINFKQNEIKKIFSKKRNHKLVHGGIIYKNIFLFVTLIFLKKIPILFLKYFRDLFYAYIKKDHKYLFSRDFLKEKNKTYQDSTTSSIGMNFEYILSDLRKFNLLNYYKKNLHKVEDEENYIYFPLHYQPEATTYPFGKNFIDQVKAIKLLSFYLKDYKIYVKEHNDTFNISHLAWAKGDYTRSKKFYDEILKIKNVRFLDLKLNSLKLIKNSKAVATISGAAGLESLLLGKPTLIFGYPWFHHFDEVFSFNNKNNLKDSLDKYMKKKIFVSKTIKNINSMSKNIFLKQDLHNQDNFNYVSEIFIKSVK